MDSKIIIMEENNKEFVLPDNLGKPMVPKNENKENVGSQENAINEMPGSIRINTAAITKPVILLIGPATVGKTVTLIRLAKFLEKGADYEVKPNKNFRSDNAYNETCEKYFELLRNTQFPPDPTTGLDFLLVDIKLKGKTMFHILEAPGEHYFNPKFPNIDWFYPYFMEILNKQIQKIFVFMFVDGFLSNDSAQQAYSSRLSQIVPHVNSDSNDKIIFCLNKVDTLGGMINSKVDNSISSELIIENTNYQTLKHRILSNREIKSPPFVAFSSGQFSPIGNGNMAWTLSKDSYPLALWKAINKKPPFTIFGIPIG
jgi:hypothetical protein